MRRFDTIAVHGVYTMAAALANQGSLMEPVYLSTAQHFEDSDRLEAALAYREPAWAYTRIANPTTNYLEATLGLLEGYGYDGEVAACVTASGMAAIAMATSPFLGEAEGGTMSVGSRRPPNIVVDPRCYGGTFTLFTERYERERGVEIRWVEDPLDVTAWAERIDPGTRFLFVEMPSNPMLSVVDLESIADIAHAHGLPLIVDSTIATPALLRPIRHGADVVVHSLSKSITSSGAVIAGAIIARHAIPSRVGPDQLRADFTSYLRQHPMRDHGPVLSPMSSYLILNELRTLRQRMDHMSRNAQAVVAYLHSHPRVERVLYPGAMGGVEDELATRYLSLVDGERPDGPPISRYGHLVSFIVGDGPMAARKTLDGFRLIWRATDLGRVKSVATIPAISTHQQQGAEGRRLARIPANLIRLSVGAEDPADIIGDLEQALG